MSTKILDTFLDRIEFVVLQQPNKTVVVNSIDQIWKATYKQKFSTPKGFGKFTTLIETHGHKKGLVIRNGAIVLAAPPQEEKQEAKAPAPAPVPAAAESKEKDKPETTWKLPFIVDDFKSFSVMEGTLKSARDLKVVAVDCEGFHNAEAPLCLLQLAFHHTVSNSVCCFLVDVLELGKVPSIRIELSWLAKLLTSDVVIKVFHDCRHDVWAVFRAFGLKCAGVIDSQIAYELLEKKCFVGLNPMLLALECKPNSQKKEVTSVFDKDPDFWSKRPLTPKMISYASEDVISLLHAYEKLEKKLLLDKLFRAAVEASALRIEMVFSTQRPESQRIMFDASDDYKLKTCEVYTALRLEANQGSHLLKNQLMRPDNPTFTKVHMKPFLDLLPQRISSKLRELEEEDPDFFQHRIREVALDVQRRPRFLVDGKWQYMFESVQEVFDRKDLEEMAEKLDGKFGADNRAGFDGELHRISCMRNKKGEIYAFTLRVGRYIYGCASCVQDFLFSSEYQHASVLFMGVPGSGKTTVIREISRLLSYSGKNVIVVDTSNEIAGDGDVPHSSIGSARRMMVPNLDEQQRVMIECLQNHTPDVMIIDEIGRKTEAVAAKTCKERGVRLFASAHGDFQSLLSNPSLNYLAGGIEQVTVGDEAARANHGRKVKPQRSSNAVFDVIVELASGEFNTWRIIGNVNEAVDRTLDGKKVKVEVRQTDPTTGEVVMSFDRVTKKVSLPHMSE